MAGGNDNCAPPQGDSIQIIGREAARLTHRLRDEAELGEKTLLADASMGNVRNRTGELVRIALKNLERKGGKLAVGARGLRHCSCSIVALLDWFIDPEEAARFEQDLIDHPSDNTAYLNSMKRLRDSLGPAALMDSAYASLRSLAEMAGAYGKESASACLRFMQKLARNSTALYTAAAVLVTCLALGYLHFAGRVPAGASLCSALVTIAVEAIASTVGAAVAASGGWLMFLVGAALGWVVSKAGQSICKELRKKSGWMDAFLRVIGLRTGPLAQPQWDTTLEHDAEITREAPDVLCSITQTMMVQPTELHGHLFERMAIEEWITAHNTHPLTRASAYRYELKPCPEMRQLVVRVQQLYGFDIVYG